MLPFVWSDDCLRHDPEAEVWVGVRTPAAEVPARAVAIRGELVAAGAREAASVAHDDSAVLAVHDPALVEYLRTAWDEWSAAALPSDRVVPYVFARSELTGGRAPESARDSDPVGERSSSTSASRSPRSSSGVSSTRPAIGDRSTP